MTKQRTIEYILKLDGEYYQSFPNLGKARQHVKDLPVHLGIANMPKKVELVKSESIYTVLNVYEPKIHTILEQVETFSDIDLA